MSLFFPRLFESNEYFIDEKLQFLKFHNEYKVYDAMGLQVGYVRQQVSPWHKILRLFLKKAMFPFRLQLSDNSDKILVTILRGWTFWLSKITILGPDGQVSGYISQR